ncbi:hypothetical protein E2C01_021585 [Portunus trituberculatus]|uniref:Uncharacterized protein n=1 Tax=Portunus trituberculatus TaxID=210409 RepID=A0A5B7E530_PORTR|nr:hypothetical protein [Portunus trituberculatus]
MALTLHMIPSPSTPPTPHHQILLSLGTVSGLKSFKAKPSKAAEGLGRACWPHLVGRAAGNRGAQEPRWCIFVRVLTNQFVRHIRDKGRARQIPRRSENDSKNSISPPSGVNKGVRARERDPGSVLSPAHRLIASKWSVRSAKLLSVTVDDQMTWKQHVTTYHSELHYYYNYALTTLSLPKLSARQRNMGRACCVTHTYATCSL